MKLIDDWKNAWKLWSVQLNIFTIIVLAVLNDLPNHIIASWSLLPEEFKSQVDQEVIAYVSIGLVILNVLSRLISQTRESVKKELENLEEQQKENKKE